MERQQRTRFLMLILFFLSGISGLVYQIVWTRMLVLVFGNTLLATSTVLSAFMAGLALGSYAFGRYIDARPRPLIKVYAWLEAGIGLYALVFPFLLAGAEPVYAALYSAFEGNIALLNLVRFATCFTLILIPTAFMGATLPVLVKRFAEASGMLGRDVGFLYGLNTAGAVVGCVAAGFLLLRTMGMHATTLVGVAINLGVAAIAWLLAASDVPVAESRKETAAAREGGGTLSIYGDWTIRMVLVGVGLSGFCALAYEVLWARMLNLFLQNNVYSFTAVIATFLAGIAIGSLFYSRFLSKVRNQVLLFVLLEVGIGVMAYASPHIFSLLQQSLFEKMSNPMALAKTAVIMIGPTVLMGIAVPAAMQICQRGPKHEGSSVGTVYAVNTIGSILGAFIAGFVLVPHVGLNRGLIIVTSLNIVAGLLALLPITAPNRRPVWVVVFAAGLVLAFLATPTTLFRDMYQRAQPNADILVYEEGKVANVVVYDFFKAGYKDLFLNRVEEASSRLWHVQLFKMLGVLPVMVHDDPDDALMVAFGAGMAAGAASQLVDALDCVDLNPDIDGVAKAFTHENLDVINNPRLNRIVNDGRNTILLSPRQYSVIISDATNPKMFDSWTLYTEEFYGLVKSRLKPGGVFGQWVLIPLPGDSIQVILKTFQSVFPHTSFWCIYGSSQCLMLGTPERLEIDYEEFAAKFGEADRLTGLTEYGVDSAEKLLSFLLLGEEELEQALRSTTIVSTDDLPHPQFQTEQELDGIKASLDLLNYQRSAVHYVTNMGDRQGEIDRKLDAYRAISRRLNMGYLLNNASEYRTARQVSIDAGFGIDPNVAFMLGHDDNRRGYFERRVADHPEDANARNNLGHIYRKQGRPDEALEQFRQAVAIDPDFANAHVNLARGYVDVGSFDEATATLIELRRINPTKGTLQLVDNEFARIRALRTRQYQGPSKALSMRLADTYMREGDTVTAAVMMEQAADEDGGDAEVYARVGAMYEDLELLERAQATYEKLAALRPADPQVQAKLDEVRLLNRDRSRRQRWFNSVQLNFGQDEGPTGHPPSCAEAARAWNDYDRGGRIEPDRLRQAAELYEESIAAKSDDMHAYMEAATIYEALGDYPRALSIWQRGLDLAPGNPTATAALRRIELLTALDQGRLDHTGEARTLDELGKVLMLGGEFERALPYLERALEITPGDPALWASLGGALDGAADFTGAVEAFERAIELERDDLRLTTLRRRLEQIRALGLHAAADG